MNEDQQQLDALRNELREARVQQAATSEVLKVISSSPGDLRPIFDAVLRNATSLCGAHLGILNLCDGEKFRTGAQCGGNPEFVKWLFERGAWAPLPNTAVGRMVAERQPVHVLDLRELQSDGGQIRAKMVDVAGARTFLTVPLITEGKVIGNLGIYRPEVRAFTEKQIALVQTFADQAAIAIENVRLFNETKEALEQLTATATILKVISSSPTDAQPVFEAIVSSCLTLFQSSRVTLSLVSDNSVVPQVTVDASGKLAVLKPFPLDRDSPAGASIIETRVIHIPDFEKAVEEFPRARETAIAAGLRSGLIVPLMCKGKAIGMIRVGRTVTSTFSDKEIVLLKTFADQAVIAIENVRLFKELQARNAEITESLEQQTATAEILKVISSSPTDVQPVFDAIIASGIRLFGGMNISLRLVKGDHTETAASSQPILDSSETHTALINDDRSPSSRAIMRRELVHITDVSNESWIREDIRRTHAGRGHRAILSAPLLRENSAIGVIAIFRSTPGPFSDKQITVLRTFADQAVIAIENVRLFHEIQDKNRQLQVASQHKSEFLANMSHELRTPLNAVIGFSEVLGERMFGELTDKQAEYVNDIHASGAHLLSLINDILDLSKVEAGRMELEVATFSVPMAIDNAITLVKERAGRHGIELECTIDPTVGDINADERKMKQILLNLMSNAVKFTPDGGRISVAAAPIEGGVEISVSDTGIGIAPEDCDAVFEEFRQVGQQSDAKAEGTGLGLALARKFVELHRGKIGVTSEVGKGSKFTFSLLNCPPQPPRDA